MSSRAIVGSSGSGWQEAEAVVTSPPFQQCDTKPTAMGGGKPTRADGDGAGRNKGDDIYGAAPGQLGAMKEGEIDAVVSSPPYAEIATGAGGLNTQPPEHEGQQSGRAATAPSQDTDQRYGETEGQLAQMEKGEVDVVISSPPFQETGVGGSNNVANRNTQVVSRNRPENVSQEYGRGLSYGETDGQLAEMPKGEVDAVVSSPPYVDAMNSLGSGIDQTKTFDGKHHGGQLDRPSIYADRSPGQLGAMKEPVVWTRSSPALPTNTRRLNTSRLTIAPESIS